MRGIGKPVGKLTSLSKCIKCLLFRISLLKYSFPSPAKETMPLHPGKLPKDRAWECEHSWTSLVGLVDASRDGAEGWLSELQTCRWWPSCHQARLAGAIMPSSTPARPLIMEFKGGSGGREEASWLISLLCSLPWKESHCMQQGQGSFPPATSPGRPERTQSFALPLGSLVNPRPFKQDAVISETRCVLTEALCQQVSN